MRFFKQQEFRQISENFSNILTKYEIWNLASHPTPGFFYAMKNPREEAVSQSVENKESSYASQ